MIIGKTCCEYFYDKYRDLFKIHGLISNMCYNLQVSFLCCFIITEIEVFVSQSVVKTLA